MNERQLNKFIISNIGRETIHKILSNLHAENIADQKELT